MTAAPLMRPPASEPSSRPVVLADGRQVVVRTLGSGDATALETALERASRDDLRRRFLGTPPPVDVLVDRLRTADGVHDYAVGAFDDAGRLVAVAQFDRLDDAPSAELGIEVAEDWQRAGLGTCMLERLLDVARRLGITRLTATYYADNLAVRRLLRRSGRVVASGIEQGEGYSVLDLTS
jgi:RimJ/RimL family protein N-acetyltransferase